MLRFDVISIFPGMIKPMVNESIMKRAQASRRVEINVHDLRDYTLDKHKKVDDRPFGGGPGMVMTPQPIYDAVKKIKGRRKAYVVLTSASGKVFDQKAARRLSLKKNLIIICGHYEGIDARIEKLCVDEAYSIGDYVLTGGELPALVIVDAVTRLIPGVIGKEESLAEESFEANLLEYPQYTRPACFKEMKVPKVLLSGHHKDIKAWRHKESIARTKKNRKDLILKYNQ